MKRDIAVRTLEVEIAGPVARVLREIDAVLSTHRSVIDKVSIVATKLEILVKHNHTIDVANPNLANTFLNAFHNLIEIASTLDVATQFDIVNFGIQFIQKSEPVFFLNPDFGRQYAQIYVKKARLDESYILAAGHAADGKMRGLFPTFKTALDSYNRAESLVRSTDDRAVIRFSKNRLEALFLYHCTSPFLIRSLSRIPAMTTGEAVTKSQFNTVLSSILSIGSELINHRLIDPFFHTIDGLSNALGQILHSHKGLVDDGLLGVISELLVVTCRLAPSGMDGEQLRRDLDRHSNTQLISLGLDRTVSLLRRVIGEYESNQTDPYAPVPVENSTFWEYVQEQLDSISPDSTHQPMAYLNRYSAEIKDIFKKIINEKCIRPFDFFGYRYGVCFAGSSSRSEMHPKSDLEFFIVYDTDKTVDPPQFSEMIKFWIEFKCLQVNHPRFQLDLPPEGVPIYDMNAFQKLVGDGKLNDPADINQLHMIITAQFGFGHSGVEAKITEVLLPVLRDAVSFGRHLFQHDVRLHLEEFSKNDSHKKRFYGPLKYLLHALTFLSDGGTRASGTPTLQLLDDLVARGVVSPLFGYFLKHSILDYFNITLTDGVGGHESRSVLLSDIWDTQLRRIKHEITGIDFETVSLLNLNFLSDNRWFFDGLVSTINDLVVSQPAEALTVCGLLLTGCNDLKLPERAESQAIHRKGLWAAANHSIATGQFGLAFDQLTQILQSDPSDPKWITMLFDVSSQLTVDPTVSRDDAIVYGLVSLMIIAGVAPADIRSVACSHTKKNNVGHFMRGFAQLCDAIKQGCPFYASDMPNPTMQILSQDLPITDPPSVYQQQSLHVLATVPQVYSPVYKSRELGFNPYRHRLGHLIAGGYALQSGRLRGSDRDPMTPFITHILALQDNHLNQLRIPGVKDLIERLYRAMPDEIHGLLFLDTLATSHGDAYCAELVNIPGKTGLLIKQLGIAFEFQSRLAMLPQIQGPRSDMITMRYSNNPSVLVFPRPAFDCSEVYDTKDQKFNLEKGRHYVFPTSGFFWKFNTERPAREYAASVLTHLIFGRGMPAVETAYLKRNDTNTVYSVLISDPVQGNELDPRYIQGSASQPASNAESKPPSGSAGRRTALPLAQGAFSEACLLAMVMYPEDGKPDNHLLEFVNGEKDLEYQITSVDNDRSLLANSFDLATGELLVKSVLFCMDNMNDRVDPNVRAHFCSLDLMAIFRYWLHHVSYKNAQYRQLFSTAEMVALNTPKKHASADDFLNCAKGESYTQSDIFDELVRQGYLTPNGDLTEKFLDLDRRNKPVRLGAKFASKQPLIQSVLGELANDRTEVLLGFKSDVSTKIYGRLYRIQSLLKEEPELRHIDLLSAIDPQMAAVYASQLAIQRDFSTRFFSLFQSSYFRIPGREALTISKMSVALTNLSQVKGHVQDYSVSPFEKNGEYDLATSVILFEDHRRLRQSVNQVRQHLLSWNLPLFKRAFNALPLPEYQQYVVNQTDFSKIPQASAPDELQKLVNIIGEVAYNKLKLTGLTLSQTQLAHILSRSNRLYFLSFSNCQLSPDTFAEPLITESFLKQKVPKLLHLELENIRGVSKMSLHHAKSVALKSLVIKACGDLQSLDINQNNLSILTIVKCDRLRHLVIKGMLTSPIQFFSLDPRSSANLPGDQKTLIQKSANNKGLQLIQNGQFEDAARWNRTAHNIGHSLFGASLKGMLEWYQGDLDAAEITLAGVVDQVRAKLNASAVEGLRQLYTEFTSAYLLNVLLTALSVANHVKKYQEVIALSDIVLTHFMSRSNAGSAAIEAVVLETKYEALSHSDAPDSDDLCAVELKLFSLTRAQVWKDKLQVRKSQLADRLEAFIQFNQLFLILGQRYLSLITEIDAVMVLPVGNEGAHAALQSIPKSKDYFLTLYILGTMYSCLDRTQFAIQSFQALVAIPGFQEHTPTHIQLGKLYLKNNEYELASASFNLVLRNNPDNENAMMGRYQAAIRKGQGQTVLREVLYQNPDQAFKVGMGEIIGSAFLQQNDLESALAHFDRDIQSGNTQFSVFLNRGETEFRLGQYEKSLQSFDSILQRQPRHINAFMGVIRSLLNQEKIDEIIQRCQNFWNQSSESALFLSVKAMISHAHRDEAVTLLQQLAASNDAIDFFTKKLLDALGSLLPSGQVGKIIETIYNRYPDHPFYPMAWAIELVKVDRDDESIPIFDAIFETHRQDIEYLYWYSVACRVTRHNEKLLELSELALAIPGLPIALVRHFYKSRFCAFFEFEKKSNDRTKIVTPLSNAWVLYECLNQTFTDPDMMAPFVLNLYENMSGNDGDFFNRLEQILDRVREENVTFAAHQLYALGVLGVFRKDFIGAFQGFTRALAQDLSELLRNIVNVGISICLPTINGFDDTQRLVAILDEINTTQPSRGISDLFATVGYHFLQLPNSSLAFKYYKKSVLADPTNPEPYHNFAVLQCLNGDYGEANRLFNLAEAMRPTRSLYGEMALFRFIQGDFAGAIQHSNHCLAFHEETKSGLTYGQLEIPVIGPLSTRLANEIRYRMGLNDNLLIDPTHFSYFVKIQALKSLQIDDADQISEMLMFFKLSLESGRYKEKEFEFGKIMIGILHLEAERYDDALTVFTEVVDHNPDYELGRQYIAECRLKLGVTE